MDIDALKEELERAVKIYKPGGDFGYGTLYNIACHFAQWGHDRTMEKMPHLKPAARAYFGDVLPRIDRSLNRVVVRGKDCAYYLTIDDLCKLPIDDCRVEPEEIGED